jgi:hypothetical protein
MGVIYKLREDVVSFIGDQKKNNPSISVRQLAALTSEKFQIKVSKSSVNDVLKKASLSSSVGRRSGISAQPEKFSIPISKKKEISENIRKTGFIREAPVPAKKEGTPVLAAGKIGAPESKEIKVKTEKTLHEIFPEKKGPLDDSAAVPQKSPSEKPEKDFVGVPMEKEPAQDIVQEQNALRRAEEERHQKREAGISVPGGMGSIFLKAAQWEISRCSLVSQIFARRIGQSVSKRFDSISDMFLFSRFFEAGSFDAVSAHRGHGLWVLNDFCNSPAHESQDLMELRELFQWSEAAGNSSSVQEMIMEYRRAKEQALLEIRGFKLLLEDKSEIAMDAAMSSFAAGGDIPPAVHGALPMDRAMTKLSNCLVSNIQNAVFYKIPGETKFDRACYDMMAVFENTPGKRILKTIVVDENGRNIAEFSIVPSHRRHFLVGVHPQQKEFLELTKTAKWAAKKSFYHRGADKIIHFSETRIDLMEYQTTEKSRPFRVLTVWKNEEAKPCWGVLTNCGRESTEEILKEYMAQWPYLDESMQEGPILTLPEEIKGQDVPNETLESLSGICDDFIEVLRNFCWKHFFPPHYSRTNINQILAEIYNVPGAFYASGDILAVSLDINRGAAYRSQLEYAARRVNEQNIFDYSGRRLWLKV